MCVLRLLLTPNCLPLLGLRVYILSPHHLGQVARLLLRSHHNCRLGTSIGNDFHQEKQQRQLLPPTSGDRRPKPPLVRLYLRVVWVQELE